MKRCINDPDRSKAKYLSALDNWLDKNTIGERNEFSSPRLER